MPRDTSSARRGSRPRSRSTSSFGAAVDLPRALTLLLVAVATLAAAGLGARVRLSGRLPVPVEGQIRRQVALTIQQDLAAAGGATSPADLETLAGRAIEHGSYAVQTGPFAGQTLNLREQITQMVPQIESLYTYNDGGHRYAYLSDLDTYHWMAAPSASTRSDIRGRRGRTAGTTIRGRWRREDLRRRGRGIRACCRCGIAWHRRFCMAHRCKRPARGGP